MVQRFASPPDASPAARLCFAAAAATVLLGSGCMSIEPPDRFLVVERGVSHLKLISEDEARLWVRELSDPDQGSLAFWAEALKNDLATQRGYSLVEEGEVHDGRGHVGRQFTFETGARGEPHGYLIAVFVDEGWFSNTIRVAEFAAPKPVFDRHVAALRKSLETLAP